MSVLQTASIGLIIGVCDKHRDAVILSVRAPTKLEDGEVKPHSFAGGSQVTVGGKLEADELSLGEEGFASALIREAREELGSAAAEVISAMIAAADASNFALLNEQVNPESGRVIRTYGLNTDWEFSEFDELAKKSHEVAKFEPCTDPDSIQILEKAHKSGGVPEGEVRMFADEKVAVQRFFERFYRPTTNAYDESIGL